MIYETYSVGGVLYHHGILGQKHGVRNGPPYPLDENDHNTREKKDGWEKSLGKRGESHHDSIYERYRNKKAKKRFEKNYKKLRNIEDTRHHSDKKDIYDPTNKTNKKYNKMLKKANVSNEDLQKYKDAKDKYEKIREKEYKKMENMKFKNVDDELDYILKNKNIEKAKHNMDKARTEVAKKVIGDYREIKTKNITKGDVRDNVANSRKQSLAEQLTIDEKYLKKRLKY